jgi:hypothetical protein
MDRSLLSRNQVETFIHQVEAKDIQLRHLRLRVDIYAAHLLKANGRDREHAHQLYKQAMRRLLSYLSTHVID